MKHFIDLGTHYFYGTIHKNGLLSFEKKLYFGQEAPYDWNVYTFEASRKAYEANIPHLPSIASRFHGFEAHNAAVAAFDGTVSFKWCPQNEAGSNCIGEHVAEIGEAGAEVYEVKAVDICRLVRDIAQKDPSAEITIKCDIEGSEFMVLPRLLQLEDVGQWVKQVFVEWHDRFWHGKDNHFEIMAIKAMIIDKCAACGVALYDWV